MNIHKTLTIFLIALFSSQITAMQQPDLRQQLFTAAGEGDNERVKQLMLAGASVHPGSLYYPTLNGYCDVVKTIFEYGVDPESPADPNQIHGEYTLFMHLVRNQKLLPVVKEKLILLYLKHGADAELRGPTGFSILTHGVHTLDFKTLKLFLERGAYADTQDTSGYTALMTLAEFPFHLFPMKVESKQVKELEYKKMAELLIKHGADVNLKDDFERTILMKAILTQNIAIVEILLNHGADIDSKDQLGQTGLMMATRNRNKTIVKLLLEKSANIDLEDVSGTSASDYVKDQPEILQLLTDAQKTKSEKS